MPPAPAEDRLGCTDCERLRDGRVAQPVNTVTSAAFVVAAGLLAARAGRAPAGPRGGVLLYSALLGLVGAGSIAFHGPQPRGAKALHDWPIVGLAAVALATPTARAVRGRPALPGWSRRRAAALGATAAAAALCWLGGRTDAPTCDPDSPLQLHGAWHVLAAAGFAQGARLLYTTAEVRT